MRQRITLKENYNGKLLCSFFSIVELHDPEKHKQGKILDCYLNDALMGEIEVVEVRTLPFNSLSPVLSYIDIGQPPHKKAAQLRQAWDNKVPIGSFTKLDHVVVRYITRQLKNQVDELFNWWNAQESIHRKSQQ